MKARISRGTTSRRTAFGEGLRDLRDLRDAREARETLRGKVGKVE